MRSPLFFLSLHKYIIPYTYTIFTSSYYPFSLSLLCLLLYLLIRLISLYLLYLVNASLSLLFHPLPFLLISPFYTIFIVKFALYKYTLTPIIFTLIAFALLITLQLAPTFTIVLNNTDTMSLFPLEYSIPLLFSIVSIILFILVSMLFNLVSISFLLCSLLLLYYKFS